MPLAHILMPQIAKKAAEIEAAIGPPQVGYLNASAPSMYGSTPAIRAKPYDKAPTPNEGFDPQLNPNIEAAGMYAPQPQDPGYLQAFKRGVVRGFDRRENPGLIPNAPAQAPAAPPVKNKRGRAVMTAAPGEAIGVAEDGQAIDRRGRKLGYLGGPAIVTPYGDVPIRTADKQKGDVAMGDQDPFGIATLEQLYGPHLKELQSNGGKFPPGYFKVEYDAAKKEGRLPKGMTLDEYKENIKKGISEMQRREKGVQI